MNMKMVKGEREGERERKREKEVGVVTINNYFN